MKIFSAKGTNKKIGFELGSQMAGAIHYNLAVLEQEVKSRKMSENVISRFVEKYADMCEVSSLRLMEGISRGSGISFNSVLRFNALQDICSPEGCTTFAAIGKATAHGNPVLMKNRDTPGNHIFTGQGHYKNREVNLVVVLRTDGGNVISGVTKAGSMGIMMGLNKYGVAVASNAGGTTEIRDLSFHQTYGISGRPQMIREGLECTTAREAVNLTLQKLTKAPMGSPGMMFFIDATDVYVIEGGCVNNQFAVQHITDGAISRSNHFELLGQLNDQKYLSAICRKIRAAELVEKNYGRIDQKKLIEFSMDHRNGPDNNSICRHGKNLEDSVTVSAAIMEIERNNPEKSRISIALGSPCWAWNNKNGNITLQMDGELDSIPHSFLDGGAFKDFIQEEPFGG